MASFKDLGLSKSLLKVLEEMGFDEPTEIQEKVIPVALSGKDVIGESATGSGKTLAFGAPIIEQLKKEKHIQVLVLTPTRELAEQNSKALSFFSKYYSLNIVSVYGGVSLENQIRGLEHADIVVGTPGRILDHISRRTINLSNVKFLVLDEADRMLDMGFIHDVTKIIERCPAKRQTFLFSATISPDINQISRRYMHNPVEISAESYLDPSKLQQFFYDVPHTEKFSLLMHLLKEENSKLVMIFCNTKRNADFVANSLRRYEFDALALHGDLNQNQRKRILEHFHKSEKLILVCTDVAARGLDIKNVSHVYNYDVPKTSTEYIHRVGRTARAGKDGKAISILADRDYENFRRVREDDSLNIEKLELPKFEKVFINSSRGNSRYSGQRHFNPRNQGRRFGSNRPDSESRSRYGSRREGGRSFNRGGQSQRFHRPQRENSSGKRNFSPRRF